jgi:hypothetical protein
MPTHRETQDFMETIAADFFFYSSSSPRTFLYTASPRNPFVVVQPRTEEAIKQIMIWVKKFITFPFSIKVGGHSPAGYCLNDNGLVMDLTKYFDNVRWLDGSHTSIIAQGGVTWDKVYQFIVSEDPSKGIIGAYSPSVGVPGYLLGGGMNRYSAQEGLGIDNIMEFSLILANGTAVQVSRNDNPDLFWALRGGGGGNFGIVIEIQIRTFNFVPIASVQACWDDFREIPGVLNTWGTAIQDPQSVLYQNFEIYRTYTQIRFCITVQGRNTTTELLNYLSPHYEGHDELFMTNYTTLPLNLPNETYPTYYQYSKSIVLDPSAFGANSPFNSIMGNALNTLKDIQLLWLVYENFGKAANLPSSVDTSFPHRNMSGVLYLKAFWPKQYDTQLGEAARSSANTLWNQLAPFDYGAYINYIDPELENWSGAYYGNNYARLTNIKNSVDPTNFFSFFQSIGSE